MINKYFKSLSLFILLLSQGFTQAQTVTEKATITMPEIAGGTVTIKATDNVIYRAETAIILQPNFIVEAGATFQALIGASTVVDKITFPKVDGLTFGVDKQRQLTAQSTKNLTVTYAITSQVPANIATVTKEGMLNIVGAGTVKVTATSEPGSTVEQTIVIAKSPQNITIDQIGDKKQGDVAFQLSPKATSGLTNFTYERVSGPVTVSGNDIIPSTNSAGTAFVKIIQSGNTNYLAKDTTISFKVSPLDASIDFPAIPDVTFGDPSFRIKANSANNAQIIYESDNKEVVTITDNNLVNIVGSGVASITARTENPIASFTQSITVRKARQIITVAPIADRELTDVPFTPTVTSNSKETAFTFSLVSGNANVALGGLISPSRNTSGPVVVKVMQSGSKNFLPGDTTFSFIVKGGIVLDLTKPTTIASDATNGINLILKNDAPTSPAPVVTFFYRKMTESKSDSQAVTSQGKVYSPSLANKLGEIGLMYSFRVSYIDKGIEKVEYTTTYTVHVSYDNGLSLPTIPGGTTMENYQIISVPLELTEKKVKDVFKDLGEHTIKRWRLFHYTTKDDTNRELTLNDTIFPGKGYWLISKDAVTINTGKGTAVMVTPMSPFKIKLKKGYNQIGNPYNFAISWTDVWTANSSLAALAREVQIYTAGGWKKSTTIKAFEGAYVFAERDMVIDIPTIKPNASQLNRVSAREEGLQGWKLDLSFSDKEGFEAKGAIGMLAGASLSKDLYDGITLPRFMNYMEINFNHPEYFAPKFSDDIVPQNSNHIWNFTVETNTKKSNLGLGWDIETCKSQPEEFYLLDKKAGVAVNMKQMGTYNFANTGSRELALYYGDKTFIENSLKSEETFINEPFPNPLEGKTTIGYALANSSEMYEVELSVYNMVMEQVIVLEKSKNKSGFYQTEWNGLDASGSRVSPGMYFVRMKTSSAGTHNEWLKKVIVK